MQSIQDENGPQEPEDSEDDEEAEEEEDTQDSEDEDSEDVMPMKMIPETTEHKIRLMKRNIPVCNRLSGSVSRAEN